MSTLTLSGTGQTAFTPLGIPSCKAWYKSDTNVYADAAANFTSANSQRLTIADNATIAFDGTGDFSFAGWFYLNSTGATQALLYKGTGTGGDKDFEIQFYVSSGNKLTIYWGNGTTADNFTCNTIGALSGSTWYFIAVTWVNSTKTMTVRLNDTTQDSKASSTVTPTRNSGELCFGTTSTAHTFPLNGVLDSWAKWNVALPAAAITALYNAAGNGRVYNDLSGLGIPTPQAWWDMDEESGTRFDPVGSNNLTASNTTIISGATLNGNFETAGAGGADVFASWTEATSGTSSINAEAGSPLAGTTSLRFDIDGSNSAASVTQTVLTVGNLYKYSLLAKANSGTPSLYVGSTANRNSHTLSTTATTYAGQFTADTTSFIVTNNSATSLSLYVDTVVLTDLGPVSTTGIAAGLCTDRNFSAHFDRVSSQILQVASDSTLQTGAKDFSIGGWAKFDYAPSSVGTSCCMASKCSTAEAGEWDIYGDESGMGFRLNKSDGTHRASVSTGALPVGSYFHIMCTYTTATKAVKVYVNAGTPTTATASADPDTNSTTFQLGGFANGYYFPGCLDGWVYYSGYALSPSEITTLVNNGKGLKSAAIKTSSITQPTAGWDLDEASGTRADAFGSRNLSSVNSVTQAHGVNYQMGLVKQWQDLSGNASHFAQSTVSKRPTYSTNIKNGKPAIRTDGVSQLLTATLSATPTAHTIFVVFQQAASGTDLGIIRISSGTTTQGMDHHLAANLYSYHGSGAKFVRQALAASTWTIATRWYDGTTNASGMEEYLNGSNASEIKTGTPATTGLTTELTIGERASGLGYAQADYLEIIVYHAALTTGQITQVYNYLNSMYAIA